MVRSCKISKEQFEEAIDKSSSVNQLCDVLGRTKTSIYTYASRFGVPLHKRWVTQDYIRNDGYLYYNNPNNHRRVYENHYGVELDSNTSVHHIDGDKSNNDISNLIALTKSDHQLAHKSLESIGFELLRQGLIEFDKDDKVYKLKKVK